jgi:hypothetical protein
MKGISCRSAASDTLVMKKYILIILFFTTSQAQAAFFDINLGLIQGSATTAEQSKSTRNLTSFGMYAHLGKSEARSGFLMGWNVTSVTVNDEFTNSGVTEKITSSDMGPAIRWYYDKEIIYSATLFYGVICKGNYQSSSADEKINGSSMNIKLSAETKINEQFLIGFSLNSYTANYSTSVTNSVQTDVSYKNTLMYPSLSLAFQF